MVNLDSQPPPDIFTWHEVLRNVLALPRTAATKFVIVGLWPAHAREYDTPTESLKPKPNASTQGS